MKKLITAIAIFALFAGLGMAADDFTYYSSNLGIWRGPTEIRVNDIGTLGFGSGTGTAADTTFTYNTTSGYIVISGGVEVDDVMVNGAGPNWGGTATGADANSFVLDFTPDMDALVTGMEVTFISHTTCTGATTLVIDSLASKAMFCSNDAAATGNGDIVENAVVKVVYDGTQYQIISNVGSQD